MRCFYDLQATRIIRWSIPLLIVGLMLLFSVNGSAQQSSETQKRSRNRQAGKNGPGKNRAQAKRNKPGKKNARTKRGNKKRRVPFKLTPKREKAALAFVRKHHRELEELLVYLRENKKPAYQRAIRDLWRADQRLASIKKRSEKRYKLELSIWKVDSRSKVLAARFVMSQKESIANELRDVLKERTELRRKALAEDRERLRKRLEKLKSQVSRLNKQLEKLDKNVENDVERRFRYLTQSRKRRNTRKVSTQSRKRTREKK